MKKKKVTAGEEFIFADGTTAETKAQLVTRLKKITPDTFAHHVNPGKNDIYTWLNECLDSDLAAAVRGLTDRQAMIDALK